ncbi:MAG: hypothetical protein OWQ59_12435 [Alicyclobacillaceae bacterium]|uniref:hypothetical protein n=1 Tax=Alicyclobacillus sp. SP_1 TaxID=2942475 RepID=UPI00215728EA|nr:hypothetical protein [Alicyclobacillus sp. SP_1]MCY0889238.1 hypothetical protein [Alicyclobacillaceae bacterium]
MPNIPSDIVGLAVLVYFIVRQITPKRPSRLRFYFLPAIALFWAYQSLPHPVPAVQIWTTVISIGVSIPFAILQGFFTRLYERNGVWVIQGDWRYLVSWLVIFALQGIIAVFSHQTAIVTWEIALGVAVVWGARSVVLHLRYPALREILARKSRN